MKARFITLNTPLFDHLDLGITERWREIDLEKATPEQLAALVQYRGHIVQVHPEDEDTFESFVAITTRAPAAPTSTPAPAPKATTKTK